LGSRKWQRSERYQKRQERIAKCQRKLAATRKKQHGELCNKVLALGRIIKTEKLSDKAFQKNFGRSVAVRAPGMFIDLLTRKAENAGGSVEHQNTRTTKLSLYLQLWQGREKAAQTAPPGIFLRR